MYQDIHLLIVALIIEALYTHLLSLISLCFFLLATNNAQPCIPTPYDNPLSQTESQTDQGISFDRQSRLQCSKNQNILVDIICSFIWKITCIKMRTP